MHSHPPCPPHSMMIQPSNNNFRVERRCSPKTFQAQQSDRIRILCLHPYAYDSHADILSQFLVFAHGPCWSEESSAPVNAAPVHQMLIHRRFFFVYQNLDFREMKQDPFLCRPIGMSESRTPCIRENRDCYALRFVLGYQASWNAYQPSLTRTSCNCFPIFLPTTLSTVLSFEMT